MAAKIVEGAASYGILDMLSGYSFILIIRILCSLLDICSHASCGGARR